MKKITTRSLDVLRTKGIREWNEWKYKNRIIVPDFANTNLRGMILSKGDFRDAQFEEADLANTDLSDANLSGAKLRKANLSNADLRHAKLIGATLVGADLSGANLAGAVLAEAYLLNANLQRANLLGVDFGAADVSQCDFTHAEVGWTKFNNIDLSTAVGLDLVHHRGASTIGVDTLYKSDGQIPNKFLRECGLLEDFITYVPSLTQAVRPINYYSCFISYSHKDEDFAKQLYARLRGAHIPTWYAPEDMRAGKKLYEQIESAIAYHDKLLLVLSNHSIHSEWVITEIRNARRSEVETGKRKLFPIRLLDFDELRQWKCFDSDTGKDLAVEIREYFIPDFSTWKDNQLFEENFSELIRALSVSQSAQMSLSNL